MKLLELVLNNKVIRIILFILYVVFIIWYALLQRKPGDERVFKAGLFWAFRYWATGRRNGRTESIQYFMNICFFMPFGFVFPIKRRRAVLLGALVLSSAIEIIQYITIRGWCEFDDIISNTVGALLGFALYWNGYKKIRCFKGDSHAD